MQDIRPPRHYRPVARTATHTKSVYRDSGPLVVRDRYSTQTVSRETYQDSAGHTVQKTTKVAVSYSVKPIEHLTGNQKQEALQKALLKARRETRRERQKVRDMKRFGLVFLAGLFVLMTGYVSIDAYLTNSQAKTELTALPAASDAKSADDTTSHQDQEGKDETQPHASSLSKYAVSPELPRALYIDKLKIAARILPMSVNNDGSVQAPKNIYDSGWYTGSVKPGDIGALFIDGHASGPTREGLFAYLDTLVEGDTLQVEKGDGTKLTYKVVHTEVVPLDGFDMKKALLPYGNTLRGLNLMTCTGKWLNGKNTYDHRVVVYTEQVAS